MANELATAPTSRAVGKRDGDRRERRRDGQGGLSALLEFQSPTASLIARPIPWTSRVTVWVVFALFASCLAVAGLFPIDRVVTATGRVLSQSANIVVQPLETSIVRAIFVREGQTVHKGELLAKLDPTFATADVGNYAAQATSLTAELARLDAEAGGRAYQGDGSPESEIQAAIFASRSAEYAYKMENYRQKIAGLQAAVQRAMSDVQGYGQRLTVARSAYDMRAELERDKVGSKLNRLSALDTLLEVQRGLETAQSAVQSSTADLQAMIQERDGYVQQHRSEVSQQMTEQSRKLADAREQLNKAALRKRLVELRADQDAVVLSVAHVSVGSVMQSGDQFITMVPTDAPLEVEVNVAGRDSGFVHVDDPVTIKFDTFTYSLYGYAKGVVRSVSPDSFANPLEDRQKVMRPQAAEDTPLGPVYYRARVSLDEIKLHDLPKSFRMQPGMSVNADIKVGERTVLGYLLGRIIPNVTEGMREP